MAFDTRDKRAAALAMFIMPSLPDPDGAAFSQSDRQMVQGVYGGIAAGPPPAITERLLVMGRPAGCFVTKKCLAENYVYI